MFRGLGFFRARASPRRPPVVSEDRSREKASSSWATDRHVRAPRSLEAKPEGLAGGRSPAGTVAPTDVAIVRRCSISFHDGFRRRVHVSVVTRARASTRLACTNETLTRRPLFFSPRTFRRSATDADDGGKRRRRVETRARALLARRAAGRRVFGPSLQAAARGSDSTTRRSSARRARRAYTGPSGKGDLLSSFRCGVAWKRRGDFFFFSTRDDRTLRRARRPSL